MGKEAGQHKDNPDKRRDLIREKNNVKVYNAFFGNDHRPRIMTNKSLTQATGLPKTTVDNVVKRFLKIGRIRKIPPQCLISSKDVFDRGGYELTYVKTLPQNQPSMTDKLEQQIERRREEIELREYHMKHASAKRLAEAYPKSNPPWFRELSKKNPVRSNSK